MASIRSYFEKGTIFHHMKNGTFFTSTLMRLLLGKSRTAHLLCSFSAQMKIKEKLEKQYLPALKSFNASYSDADYTHNRSSKIWVCWFQGIENAPELVKRCYQSMQDHLPGREITLITEENMSSFVQFPDHILDKWKKGMIPPAHMSDLLRLELLIRYGGTWIDATVLFTGDCAPDDYRFDSDLFFYQMLPPGRGGHTHIASSWFITAGTNNQVLMAVRHLLYEYWKTHTALVDYFLFHDFFIMELQQQPQLWQSVLPMDVSLPSHLQYNFFKTYSEDQWKHICSITPMHKLSYKFAPEKAEIENTFYRHVMKDA